MENPNVFISYSHDNDAHKAWVLKLATDLRSHGVNAILDQWELRLGSDLRFFMEQGLNNSNLVLCISSEAYVQKADSGHGGSGYEAMIMTQSLLRDQYLGFVIPVIRNNLGTQKTPLAFGSKSYIDFNDDDNYFARYQELLERIYDEDVKRKPALGENPFSDKNANSITIMTTLEKSKYQNPLMEGTASFDFKNNSGCFTIGTGDYEFVTSWSECDINTIYAYRDKVKLIGYRYGQHVIPDDTDFSSFDFTSRTREVSVGEVLVLMNRHNKFAAVKIINIDIQVRGKKALLSFEYKIYQ